MIINIIYIILAAFGLGLLVFIHELGHYFMARRVGMRVEAFGIGFGKPILSWEHKGVKWNINMLPFGGYVRIAGMEKEGHLEPHQIPDGFFGKSPWDRIKVALAGPIVNIIFALFLFLILWMAGGREKPFSEFTRIIGWVDTESQLYQCDVKPGDEITQYDGHAFNGFSDLMYSSLLADKSKEISGYKIDYATSEKEPFHYVLDTYPDPRAIDPSVRTIGVFSPARYLIYANHDSVFKDSPMAMSGIQNRDRIVWADGQLIFSMSQLSQLTNDSVTLLTVKRGEQIFQTRIPRLKVGDIQFMDNGLEEINDWQHESDIRARTSDLYFIPYDLTHNAMVENPLTFIDQNLEEHSFQAKPRSMMEIPLERGDQIIAADGTAITSSAQLLSHLQQRHVEIIVQRPKAWKFASWKEADQSFINSFNWTDLSQIISTIGTENPIQNVNDYYLLNPIVPKPLTEFSYYNEKKESYEKELSEKRKIIEGIKNPNERKQALQLLEENQKRAVLGFIPQDLPVRYNPDPFALFVGVFEQMYRTIKSLVTGMLSPKWMSGPVGIVQVFHYGWSQGIKEALYWMGLISLNLGIINLLPIPVLDGGHILFAIIEKIKGKPLKAKTMERWIIPFVILIVIAFIYFTYNDLVRLFSRYF